MKKYEIYKESGVKWLGKVPFSWSLVKLKYVLETKSGSSINAELISDDFDIPAIGGNGILGKTNNYNSEGKDIVIGRVGAHCGNVHLVDGKKWVTDNALLIKTNFNEEYLTYVLKFLKLNRLANTNAQPLITGTIIKEQFIALSNERENHLQIAKYLDHKTEIIDTLIEKKEQLLKKLQAQRQAIINEAVTKGLNKNAKMKASGIEWLGEIPEHWEVARIGNYVNIFRGASPRPAGDPKLFKGDFMPWITVSEVANGNSKFLTETKYFLTELGSKQSRIVIPETLLLSNSGATLGVPKITLIEGCINDGSVAFDSFNEKLKRDFLYHFFITHTKTYREEMAGYGQPNLNTEIIKSTKIPLPPIEEQLSIIEFIEKTQDNLSEILKTSKLSIQKLKIYRQSIVSEAVTGKIDVRDWQEKK